MKAQRIELLHKYIEENPSDPFNHYALAMEYRDENPGKALEILRELTKKHPDYHAAYYHQAALEYEFGQYEAAKATYQKGIAICTQKGENKLLQELNSAYQELLFELDEL